MMQSGPGVWTTLALLAAGLAIFGLAALLTGRAPDPAKGPRMIPWTMVALTAAVFCLVMIVHLVNLMGVETGGRMRF